MEAAVELHEEVGPAETTITAIAERAGVQRLTVYRHFPDEESLFGACSAHWREAHPLPEAGVWAGIERARERAREALAALYGYYRRGEEMIAKTLRDLDRTPGLEETLVAQRAFVTELKGQLGAGWGVDAAGQVRVRAAVGHAVRFETWRSLASEGLGDAEAAELMADFIRCVAEAGGG